MAITLVFLLFWRSVLATTATVLNATAPAEDDVAVLFNLIMQQVGKIQKNEISDFGYTKLIFALLILSFIFSIKSQIYKLLTCAKRKKKLKSDDCALETITIKEFNYNVNN
ncbi:unknown [Euproctis pseudoconspersa nucleopolyhedrovirus]|uniref:Uncharacterized protein n=1 Tax=Euproctis pseudoconspersa nucleopolyhedrovirus TaxID=307467 RepID=Q599F9_9ABAC|nr:hypothetical protein EupsNPV_gp129 [Euproctis pseudoconspersa nucleopolyhedrovirus]ACO53579.1 unknown [Euproctis pseudoconspersa nucleopolyhedrovirus]QUJ09319.1 hypothetical protein Gyru_ORF124 [Gynaephora ruoergensis nucleopolyhedrovirus]CAI72632.1 hypothetical protein [Euproctis pseudoconspersa nucleopolyhedrovirus]